MHRLLSIFALTGFCIAAYPIPNTMRWWSHVQYLADDKLEGRDTGSEGYRKAAAYVVEQLKAAGVEPAGENGFYQTAKLKTVQLREEQSTVSITRGGKAEPVVFGLDARATARAKVNAIKDVPMVFIGYGLKVPALNYDDLKGTDLKGKVAVYINAGPTGVPAAALATAQRSERWKYLAEAGAVGAIAIANPRATEAVRWPTAAPPPRAPRAARTMTLASDPNDFSSGKVNLNWNPARTQALLEGSGHQFVDLLDLAVAGKPLPHFALTPSLSASIDVAESPIESDNVIGMLPGSDARLRNEILVVSAHLDGYGIGQPVNGDAIYNGAFDDAAYVAELIEFALRIKESGKRPRRSVLFAIYTGEEKGLLGSAYFTSHLTVEKSRIVGNINLDYLRPIFPLKILTVLALDQSTLGDDARAIAKQMGIEVRPDMEPDRNLFARSDQYNFIRNGIPGIAFVFGYDNGSPEEAIYRKWYAERYHKPSDDLKQPIDFDAAAKFNEFFERLSLAVANGAEKPRWK